MDGEGRANSLFGSAARGTSHPTPGEDAIPGALSTAEEEGQEEGQGGAGVAPAARALRT